MNKLSEFEHEQKTKEKQELSASRVVFVSCRALLSF